MPFYGNDPLSAFPHQPGSQQGGAGGGHAQSNATRAQAARERLAVTESVLEGDGESPLRVRQAIPELFRDMFCLPCLDQDQRVLDATAFTRVIDRMDWKPMFVAVRIEQSNAILLQCLQPGFP